MAKQLSEDEQKARVKYKGMTRREYNAQHSKFANHRPKSEDGSFEIVALYSDNPIPQTAPFPNEAAALARFDVLRASPACQSVKVVKNVVRYGIDGKPSGLIPVTLYSLTKTGQQFANSKVATHYRRKGTTEVFGMDHILRTPELISLSKAGQLEVAKVVITGGKLWWDTKA